MKLIPRTLFPSHSEHKLCMHDQRANFTSISNDKNFGELVNRRKASSTATCCHDHDLIKNNKSTFKRKGI